MNQLLQCVYKIKGTCILIVSTSLQCMYINGVDCTIQCMYKNSDESITVYVYK